MTNNFAFLKRIFSFERTWRTSFSGSTENLAKSLIEDLPEVKFYRKRLLVFSEYQKTDNLHEKIDLEFANASELKIGEINIILNLVNDVWEINITRSYAYTYISFSMISMFFLGIAIYLGETTLDLAAFFMASALLFLFLVVALLFESKRVLNILTNYVLSKFDSVEE